MNVMDIVALLFFITSTDAIFFAFFDVQRLDFVDPVANYREWTEMNWFGVIFFTLILNVACPVISVCYWFIKLCTVGRKG